MEVLNKGTDAYQQVIDKIAELEEKLSNGGVSWTNGVGDTNGGNSGKTENEAWETNLGNKLKTYKKYVDQFRSLTDTLIGIKQRELEQDVRNGKISEQEAEKRFENFKKMQIATTVLSVLAGASGDFFLTSKDPVFGTSPIRWVVAAARLASDLALGYAQIAQIKSQSFNGGGGAIGNAFNGIATQPIINEALDTNSMQEVQINRIEQVRDRQNDQRVYILQSDIVASNKQVEIRQEQTTF